MASIFGEEIIVCIICFVPSTIANDTIAYILNVYHVLS